MKKKLTTAKEYTPFGVLVVTTFALYTASGQPPEIQRTNRDSARYTQEPDAVRANLIKPLLVQRAVPSVIGAIDMVAMVRYAKLHLGIPDKDLATLFNLSRQHIHNYRTGTGSEPQPSTLVRAREMYSLILEMSDIFSLAPSHAMKNVYLDNTSLFELLDTVSPEHDRIIAFARELETQLVARRQRHSNSAASELDREFAIHAITRIT